MVVLSKKKEKKKAYPVQSKTPRESLDLQLFAKMVYY